MCTVRIAGSDHCRELVLAEELDGLALIEEPVEPVGPVRPAPAVSLDLFSLVLVS